MALTGKLINYYHHESFDQIKSVQENSLQFEEHTHTHTDIHRQPIAVFFRLSPAGVIIQREAFFFFFSPKINNKTQRSSAAQRVPEPLAGAPGNLSTVLDNNGVSLARNGCHY